MLPQLFLNYKVCVHRFSYTVTDVLSDGQDYFVNSVILGRRVDGQRAMALDFWSGISATKFTCSSDPLPLPSQSQSVVKTANIANMSVVGWVAGLSSS